MQDTLEPSNDKLKTIHDKLETTRGTGEGEPGEAGKQDSPGRRARDPRRRPGNPSARGAILESRSFIPAQGPFKTGLPQWVGNLVWERLPSRGARFLDHPEISPPAPIRGVGPGRGRPGPAGAGAGPGRELGPALAFIRAARPARPAPEVLVLVRPAVPFRPRGFVTLPGWPGSRPCRFKLARASCAALPRRRGPLQRAAPAMDATLNTPRRARLARHTVDAAAAPRAGHAAPCAGQTAPPGRTASRPPCPARTRHVPL